jgi:hypothetical protein
MNKEQIIIIIIILVILINLIFLIYAYNQIKKLNNYISNNDIPYDENILEEPYIVPEVIIKDSKLGGRGVFANTIYKKNDIIEICPAVLSNKNIINGRLRDYIFGHNKDASKCLIAFGYISIYNHQDSPNSIWNVINDKQIKLTALRDIKKGEEITVSYGDNYWNSRNYLKN